MVEGKDEFLIGGGFGSLVDRAYAGLTGYKDTELPVHHEHWGMVSLIVASRFPRLKRLGQGFGAALIAAKALEPDPLGTQDTPVQRKLELGLNALLGGVLIMAYSKE